MSSLPSSPYPLPPILSLSLPPPPSPIESNYNLCNMVTQNKFLSTLQEDMKNPSKARIVLESIEQLRQEITKPTNLRVFVSGDVTTVTGNPAHPWIPFPHLPSNISPA